jgi:hypothetical protein
MVVAVVVEVDLETEKVVPLSAPKHRQLPLFKETGTRTRVAVKDGKSPRLPLKCSY